MRDNETGPIATDPNVIAVVASSDGTYFVCTTPDEVLDAIDAVVANGETPVLFHRGATRQPDVVNINHDGNGPIVQARDIQGGVRF